MKRKLKTRYKFYKQLDNGDCGITCLRMISKFYGKDFSSSFLIEKCHKSKTGVSLLNLKDSAESLHFKTLAVNITWKQLTNEKLLPCIIHWNQKHFVVLYEITKNRIVIADPAKGILKYNHDAFKKCWIGSSFDINSKGIVLIIEPTPSFYNLEVSTSKTIKLISLFNYLNPHKRKFLHIIFGLVLTATISMLLPFLTQLVVDNGIQSKDINFIILIFIAQIFLTVGQTINSFLQSWFLLHITSKVSVKLVSDFLAKLMNLKIAFFDTKLIGDIIQRIADFERIEIFLTSSLISIVTIIVTLFIFGNVILKYSIIILLIFILGSFFYIIWVSLFLKKRSEIDYMRFQELSMNNSNIIQLISGIQDIKLNNCENKKRWEWEQVQVKLHEINFKGLNLSKKQEIGGVFIEKVKNILISFISAKYVIQGDLTIGMLVAIQYTIGQLNVPIYQLIGLLQKWQEVKISLERINEIYSKEEEDSLTANSIIQIPNSDIVIKNLSFQYGGRSSPKVLEKINFIIPSNKITAIVGASGSGKTTLMKLLLGYYDPIEGDILLGNEPLKNYNKSIWRSHCAIVMQEGYIFSDTILGNIGLSDNNPDLLKAKRASDIANMKTFIESLPLKYDTKIGSEGQNISTGQKQRILIARAVYKNVNYIFFDEATNSLDATNEKTIMDKLNIFFQNKTVVIIAHRLSTVKKADNIIVLQNSKVVESGNHQFLVSKKGYYFQLVKDQLELGE
jgi:ATP-binding cassette subfamily B protein